MVCVVITLWNFVTVYKGQIMFMRISGAINTLLFFLLIIFASITASDINNYKQNFKCYETMAAISDKSYDRFDCSGKYSSFAFGVDQLINKQNCSVESIRYIWEDQ